MRGRGRRRNSIASRAKRTRGETSHILINNSGPSFSDLPGDILVNILLRLTTKRVFVCKGVCKTWYDVISDPKFAKSHFEQAEVYPLIRTLDQPSTLYLFQPEKDDFELKLDMCDHDRFKSDCVSHVDVEVDTKFELPLSNLLIVNSCNGLLCLSDPSDKKPLIICNPITGEFMKLPKARNARDLGLDHSFGFSHGFGFSPSANQYKVLRMSEGWMKHSTGFSRGPIAEVHILGTEVWKDIGFRVTLTCPKLPPIYLNGFLYWFSDLRPVKIRSFDLEKEHIELVAKQPLWNTSDNFNNVGMGVLGGELCMTGMDKESFWSAAFSVWVLKDCDAKQEWSKLFSIELDSKQGGLFNVPYQPIKYLNDGALLTFQPYKNRFLYKDPTKLGFKLLKFRGLESGWMEPRVEVIAHIPSFVSLKQALSLSGQNVKVLNVKPRYAELEVQNKRRDISIVEEVEVAPVIDLGSDSEDMEPDSDSEDMEPESDSKDREIEPDLEDSEPESNSEDR